MLVIYKLKIAAILNNETVRMAERHIFLVVPSKYLPKIL